MTNRQLFGEWLDGPEGRRISNQLEGWSVGERLWALAEEYRRSHAEVAIDTIAPVAFDARGAGLSRQQISM